MRILTITDKQDAYGNELLNQLKQRGFRVAIDDSSDQINAKIKSAQLDKIPWMLVVGQKEVDNKTVSIRYSDGKQEMGLNFDTVLAKAEELNRLDS